VDGECSPFCRDLRSELEAIETNISTLLAPLHAFHQEKDEAVTTFTMRAVRAGRFQLAQQFWREGLEALSNPNPSLTPALLATIPGHGGHTSHSHVNSNGGTGRHSPPSGVSTLALMSPTAASPLATMTGSATPTARLHRNNTPPRALGFTSETLLPPNSSPSASSAPFAVAVAPAGTIPVPAASSSSAASVAVASAFTAASGSAPIVALAATIVAASTTGSTSSPVSANTTTLAPLVGRRMSVRDVRLARSDLDGSPTNDGTLAAPVTSSTLALSPVRSARRHTFSPDGKVPLPTIPSSTTLAAAAAAAAATSGTDSPHAADSPNRVIGNGSNSNNVPVVIRPTSVSGGSGASSPSPPGTGTSTPTRAALDPPLDRMPSTIGLPAAASSATGANIHMPPLTHSFSFSSTISATSSGTFTTLATSAMSGNGTSMSVPVNTSSGPSSSIFGIDAQSTSSFPPKSSTSTSNKRGSLNLKLKPMNPARGSLRQMPAIAAGATGSFFVQAQAVAAAKARDAAALAAAQQQAAAAAIAAANAQGPPPTAGSSSSDRKENDTPLDSDRSGGIPSVSQGGGIMVVTGENQVRLGTPTSIVGSSIPEEGVATSLPASHDPLQPYFSPSNQPGEPATPTSMTRHTLVKPLRASGGAAGLVPLSIIQGGSSPHVGGSPANAQGQGPPSPLVFYPSDSSVEAGFRRLQTPPPGIGGPNNNNSQLMPLLNRPPSVFMFGNQPISNGSQPLPPAPSISSSGSTATGAISPPRHNNMTPPGTAIASGAAVVASSITIPSSSSTSLPAVASTSSPVIPILAGTLGSSSTSVHTVHTYASPRGAAAAASMKEHLTPSSVAPAPLPVTPTRPTPTIAFIHPPAPAAPLPPLPNLRVLLASPSEGNLHVPNVTSGKNSPRHPATINESPAVSARNRIDVDLRPGTAQSTMATSPGTVRGSDKRGSALLTIGGGLRTPVFRIASGGTSVYLRHGEVNFLQLCQGESLAVRGLEQHDLNAAEQRLAALVLKMESEKKKWVRALLEEVFGEMPPDNGRRRTGPHAQGHGHTHAHAFGGRRGHNSGNNLANGYALPPPATTATTTAAASLVSAVALGSTVTERKDFLTVQLHPHSAATSSSSSTSAPLSPTNGNSSPSNALEVRNGVGMSNHSSTELKHHDSSLSTPPLTVVPLFRLEAIRCLEDLLRGCVQQQRDIELALQATQPWIVPHQLGSPSIGNGDGSPNGSPPAGRTVAFAPSRR
jgi:hypothetical protein